MKNKEFRTKRVPCNCEIKVYEKNSRSLNHDNPISLRLFLSQREHFFAVIYFCVKSPPIQHRRQNISNIFSNVSFALDESLINRSIWCSTRWQYQRFQPFYYGLFVSISRLPSSIRKRPTRFWLIQKSRVFQKLWPQEENQSIKDSWKIYHLPHFRVALYVDNVISLQGRDLY